MKFQIPGYKRFQVGIFRISPIAVVEEEDEGDVYLPRHRSEEVEAILN